MHFSFPCGAVFLSSQIALSVVNREVLRPNSSLSCFRTRYYRKITPRTSCTLFRAASFSAKALKQQHTTQLLPIAPDPPEAMALPTPSRASGSCHHPKPSECCGYKGAPGCNPAPDKDVFWPLADWQSNRFSCSSENGNDTSLTKQLLGSVRIICYCRTCAHVSERKSL